MYYCCMANLQINNGKNQQDSYYENLPNKAHKRFLDRFVKCNISSYIYGNNQIYKQNHLKVLILWWFYFII